MANCQSLTALSVKFDPNHVGLQHFNNNYLLYFHLRMLFGRYKKSLAVLRDKLCWLKLPTVLEIIDIYIYI